MIYCQISIGLSGTIHLFFYVRNYSSRCYAFSKDKTIQGQYHQDKMNVSPKPPDHNQQCLLIQKRDDRSVCGLIEAFYVEVYQSKKACQTLKALNVSNAGLENRKFQEIFHFAKFWMKLFLNLEDQK